MTNKEQWQDLILSAVERWVHNDDALLDLITEHLRDVDLPSLVVDRDGGSPLDLALMSCAQTAATTPFLCPTR